MAESDSGDRYEFDAPSHVVDFVELQNAESDDTWFDQQISAADGHLKTPLRTDQGFERSNGLDLPRAIVTPRVKTDECAGSTNQFPNVETSWGPGSPTRTGARPKRNAANQSPAQPRRVSKRKEMTSGPAPPSKKHKKTPPVACKSSSVFRNKGASNTRAAPKTRKAASTIANTEPNSSEEQELERIRNFQKEVALLRKKNEASYKAALAGNPPPKKMVLSATVPKEFHFNTNNRVKATTSSSTAHKETDFINRLRKPSSPDDDDEDRTLSGIEEPAPISTEMSAKELYRVHLQRQIAKADLKMEYLKLKIETKAMKGATVPKPFNLSTGNKREAKQLGTYVPMAQQIEQFQKRTPDRYHLRSRQSRARGPSAVKGDKLKLTQPHTPHLTTRQRSRPANVKSSADLEAEEVEKLHKSVVSTGDLHCSVAGAAAHITVTTAQGQTVCFCEETKDDINLDVLDDVAWCQIQKLTSLMDYLLSRSHCQR